MSDEASNGHFRLSEPPADVSPPVAVAEPPASAQSLGGGFILSEPPPDVVADVQVVAVAAQLSAEPGPKAPDYADEPNPAPLVDDAAVAMPGPLDEQAIYRIIREVALDHSGDELYSAVRVDANLGVLVGLVGFPQASPHLGSYLQLAWTRDPAAFQACFGPDAVALLETTGARRLMPVGGEPLSSPAWIERFRAAGQVPAFQAAQNEEAIERQFRPLLDTAFGLGLTSERGLAMLYDTVVSHGLGGGLRWAVQAASPLRDATRREQALRALGFPDLATFQASVPGLTADGLATAPTHVALVAALRERAAILLPGPGELAACLVAAAHGGARARLLRLLDSPTLSDAVVARS